MANCPTCGYRNADAAEMCFTCGRALFGLTQGSVLGDRYEIREALGQGGMGMVYKAHDKKLDETVAIKILRAGFAGNPDLEKRFLSEIKLARKVTHKNICRIHEYGEHQGVRYISMALVEGTDLKRLMKEKGALPPGEAYDAAIQVAEGLQAIHEEGIVHRDLKPANLVRDAKGVVRLLDFGIAKEAGAATTDGLTTTGMVVGTPDYVSPEQALGKQADARSDIYSLAVVIFELFTGQAPFKGDSAFNTMQKHVHQPPPLEGMEAARIPRLVIPILRKALAKDASLRYQTAREMADALKSARDARPGALPPATTAASPHTLSQAATTALPGPRTARPSAPALGERDAKPDEAGSPWTSPWLPLGAFALLLVLWMRGPGAAQPKPTPPPLAAARAETPPPIRIVVDTPAPPDPARALDPTNDDPASLPSPPSPTDEPARDASPEARHDLQEDCERGQGEACLRLGEGLRTGRLGERNPALAVQALERACRFNVPRGCSAAATMHLLGQGIAQDRTRAMELLKEACDGHEAPACSLLEQLKRGERRPAGPR